MRVSAHSGCARTAFPLHTRFTTRYTSRSTSVRSTAARCLRGRKGVDDQIHIESPRHDSLHPRALQVSLPLPLPDTPAVVTCERVHMCKCVGASLVRRARKRAEGGRGVRKREGGGERDGEGEMYKTRCNRCNRCSRCEAGRRLWPSLCAQTTARVVNWRKSRSSSKRRRRSTPLPARVRRSAVSLYLCTRHLLHWPYAPVIGH